MTDKEWEAFVKWCQTHWPSWTPNRSSVEIYLKWRDDEYSRIHEDTKTKSQG